MAEKDISLIPIGEYCYSNDNGKFKTCEYWKVINDRPSQYNGWCDYLEKGDLEIEKDMILIDCKTGEKINGNNLPFAVSLLWDQCKECEIKLSNFNEVK